MAPPPDDFQITGLCDGTTWAEHRVDTSKGRTVTLWIAGLPANADRNNVRVYLEDRPLNIAYLETRPDDQPRQVNVDLPEDVRPGKQSVTVAIAGIRTPAVILEIAGD